MPGSVIAAKLGISDLLKDEPKSSLELAHANGAPLRHFSRSLASAAAAIIRSHCWISILFLLLRRGLTQALVARQWQPDRVVLDNLRPLPQISVLYWVIAGGGEATRGAARCGLRVGFIG
jgi:hypothetical protein